MKYIQVKYKIKVNFKKGKEEKYRQYNQIGQTEQTKEEQKAVIQILKKDGN